MKKAIYLAVSVNHLIAYCHISDLVFVPKVLNCELNGGKVCRVSGKNVRQFLDK